MAATTQKLLTLPAKTAFMRRKFHAWWEGYAFDDAAERAAVAAQFPGALGPASQSATEMIAQSIWGEGRFEPGSPAWTMRFARTLSLPLKAKVVIFGAGGGAVLEDLRHATRWKVNGLTRHESAARGKLESYSDATRKLPKAYAAGALSFFEMHRDRDPANFAVVAGGFLLPGARASFVDFTVPRRLARLRTCFPSGDHGAPRQAKEFEAILSAGGLRVTETVDETSAYLPLITKGWAGWRGAYEAINTVEHPRMRSEFVSSLGCEAHLWAERLDALKSGRLQVTRFQVVKT